MPKSKKVQVYVAFSIGEELTYLVATKSFKSEQEYRNWILDKRGVFWEVENTLEGCASVPGDVKLHYSGLANDPLLNKPTHNANTVLSAFCKLKSRYGFEVAHESVAAFVHRHPHARACA